MFGMLGKIMGFLPTPVYTLGDGDCHPHLPFILTENATKLTGKVTSEGHIFVALISPQQSFPLNAANMKPSFIFSSSILNKTVLPLLLMLAMQGHLAANNTIALGDVLDEHGRIANPRNLTGAVDFSDYVPVIDECEGLVFMPPPVAPGWNALGSGLNDEVIWITISGTDLYVGGRFTDAGGVAAADRIARWNGSSWNALGSGLNEFVSAIAISGSDIYVSGNFTDAGGVAAADYIARWNGSSWNALGSTPLNAVVRAIGVSGSNVYVGGEFTDAGGIAAGDYIARWNGSSWNAVGSGLNALVRAITISGSDVYVGGAYTNAGGNAAADCIARWNGSSWNAVGSGLNALVYAITISGSDIYLGGDFTDAGGIAAADRIARWNGSSWSAFGSGLSSTVRSIAISGSNMFVGGFFLDAGGIAAADYIARWNGSAWSALGSSPLNGVVYVNLISGSNVYVGGNYTDAGGIAAADRFARWEDTSLPVELTDFKAAAQAPRTTLLTWRTASERNNEGFDIERSTDGTSWENIGFVPGHGTTQSENAYSFTDKKPLPGVNYYRLKQVDFDGNFEYSTTESVLVVGSQHTVFHVYPNPVRHGKLTVHFDAEPDESTVLRVYDCAGKLLHQQLVVASENYLEVANFEAGIYLLQVSDRRETWQERFVVQKP